MFRRLSRILYSAFLVAAIASPQAIASQQFFSIGTGGTSGTYYPIGGLIANAISNPPGSRSCEDGGSCGVEGLIAIARSANGSVANVNAIQSGQIDSGFVQSDVAHWAFNGTGIFAAKEGEESNKKDKLRLLANLYPESIHLVARKDSGIKTVADLKGKRVSLDSQGSGTLEDARLILKAYGLTEDDIVADYIKPGPSVNKIKDNQLDAFFIVSGYPTGSVVELAASEGLVLVPISGPEADKILAEYSFFSKDVIPAGTYEGVDVDTPTLSVGAQFIVSADASEELVYNIAKALWNDTTRNLLDNGHPKGKLITKETATDGAGIPFHPGAEKFYKEMGLLK